MPHSAEFMKECLPSKLTTAGLASIMKCLENDESEEVTSLKRMTLRMHIKEKLTDDNETLVSLVENVRSPCRFKALMYSDIPELAQFIFKHSHCWESQTIITITAASFRIFFSGNREVLVRKFKGAPPLDEVLWYLRETFQNRVKYIFPVINNPNVDIDEFKKSVDEIAAEMGYAQLQDTPESLVYGRQPGRR